MDMQGSISVWIGRLKAGEADAPQALWERYYRRLVELARGQLGGRGRTIADEEDVALLAFDGFFHGVAQGRFPKLEDRDDLWQVLLVLTARKVIDCQRRETRAKRGQPVQPDADVFAQVLGREPTPELAAETAEQVQQLLDGLDDATLRAVAVDKMEGYSNEEIAERLGCSVSTVERK
jgi:RNA polymerase sigma factor (sigma-70 family)